MYDVAIIGAGPAGAILAGELAKVRGDIKILLVNGSAECDKVCGGLLSPDAQDALSSLGLTVPESVLSSPQTSTVDTIDLAAGVTRVYGRDYVNMDRRDFDAWLLSLVPESVTVKSGRCTSIKRTEGGFDIRLREGDSYRNIYASIAVGADGASSIVRRNLFPAKSVYKYVSIQEWYDLPGEDLPVYSCIYDPKTSDSCSWTIRKGNSFVFGGAFIKKGCRDAFLKQKERLEAYYGISLGEVKKREACLVASPRRCRDFFIGEDGAYLVGEAAGFISSSSFEGISSALKSGKLLAESIAVSKDKQSITREYRRRVRSLILKLTFKIPKMKILTSPMLRFIIMKSGVTAKKISK